MHRICKFLLAISLLVLVSCSSSDEAGTTTTTAAPTPVDSQGVDCGDDGEITVAAAASLTEPFEAIGESIEAACDGATVTFTFDSSGSLSTQILDGAPVDVFASADEANVAKVAALAVGAPEVFARNRLVIVTKPGNPEGIESLADLVDVGVVSLCATDAPCGRFATEALEGAGVSLDESQVTRGQNAKATLTAVAEGDAVAGIVYVTDALAAGDAVEAITIPEDQNVEASYPVVVLDGPGDRALAEAFAAALTADDAQEVLGDQGFLAPT